MRITITLLNWRVRYVASLVLSCLTVVAVTYDASVMALVALAGVMALTVHEWQLMAQAERDMQAVRDTFNSAKNSRNG